MKAEKIAATAVHTLTVCYLDPAGEAHMLDVTVTAGRAPFDNPAQAYFGETNRRLKRKDWLARMAQDLAHRIADQLDAAGA